MGAFIFFESSCAIFAILHAAAFLCLVKLTVVFACLGNLNEIPPLAFAYTFILSCCHLPMLGLTMYFMFCTI